MTQSACTKLESKAKMAQLVHCIEPLSPSDEPVVTHVVILAAGQGTRMKSNCPRSLHRSPAGPWSSVLDTAALWLRPRDGRVVGRWRSP